MTEHVDSDALRSLVERLSTLMRAAGLAGSAGSPEPEVRVLSRLARDDGKEVSRVGGQEAAFDAELFGYDRGAHRPAAAVLVQIPRHPVGVDIELHSALDAGGDERVGECRRRQTLARRPHEFARLRDAER